MDKEMSRVYFWNEEEEAFETSIAIPVNPPILPKDREVDYQEISQGIWMSVPIFIHTRIEIDEIDSDEEKWRAFVVFCDEVCLKKEKMEGIGLRRFCFCNKYYDIDSYYSPKEAVEGISKKIHKMKSSFSWNEVGFSGKFYLCPHCAEYSHYLLFKKEGFDKKVIGKRNYSDCLNPFELLNSPNEEYAYCPYCYVEKKSYTAFLERLKEDKRNEKK